MSNSPSIDCSTLGPIFGPLISAAPLNELGAGHPDPAAAKTIREISLTDAFAPHRIIDQSMAAACLAGLWLMFDHLDESHTISQSIDTPTGSYWHAIMHRREGDFDNSKYWFRRVGTHPIFASLVNAGNWDPYRFVDQCAAAKREGLEIESRCRTLQQRECQLLFDFCYRQAIGLS